jgi:hypothetical protein
MQKYRSGTHSQNIITGQQGCAPRSGFSITERFSNRWFIPERLLMRLTKQKPHYQCFLDGFVTVFVAKVLRIFVVTSSFPVSGSGDFKTSWQRGLQFTPCVKKSQIHFFEAGEGFDHTLPGDQFYRPEPFIPRSIEAKVT